MVLAKVNTFVILELGIAHLQKWKYAGNIKHREFILLSWVLFLSNSRRGTDY